MVEVRTPAGLILKPRLAFDVELQRIFRIVEKTVRGLFFHETGHRIRSDYEVDVHSNDTLREESADTVKDLEQTIIQPLSQKVPILIGESSFLYRFHITEEDPFLSVWALTFYQQVPFLCMTGPRRLTNSIMEPTHPQTIQSKYVRPA